MSRLKTSGFTLIELIMVIVIVGILSTMTTDIITLPVKSYLDLERRTALVDSAEMALRRMQRDIRQALPNSIRMLDASGEVLVSGSGVGIEFLHVAEGGRYRANFMSDTSDPDYPGDILNFTDSSDNSFEVIGSLKNAPTSGDKLVIYNVGSSGADAYVGGNRRTITNTSTVDTVVFNSVSPAKPFPFESPQQRFFIVDMPIAYICDAGELKRYDNFPINGTPANGEIQAKSNSISCVFTYDPGTNTRAGLVTLTITLRDEAEESVKLMHQVHVDNMP